jgi:hypothetical protein
MVTPLVPKWRAGRTGGQATEQAAPLSVNAAGFPFVPFHVPVNPKVAVPPAGRDPFQLTLVTVAVLPLPVTVAFQAWPMVWPLGNVHCSVQPFTALLPVLRIVTSPWKPPCHWLLMT